ncbi:MAG: GntR family transcriptional regulator [Acidobacteria bacterium]|nr:GntR family transcriptional regulator [Acidobacteriota bacterium]
MIISDDPEADAPAKAAHGDEVERVYHQLKSWLLECRMVPGEPASEVDLARECHTSRTPVREACNRLAQDGWITRIPRRGYVVTPVSIKDLLQTYEYRKVLECFAVEKAANVASEEQLESLSQIIQVESTPGSDLDEIVSASDAFHLRVAEIAGNQRVFHQMKLTLEYCHRLAKLAARTEHGWTPHGEIFAALRSRRPTEARLAAATHIEFARDQMLKMFAK